MSGDNFKFDSGGVFEKFEIPIDISNKLGSDFVIRIPKGVYDIDRSLPGKTIIKFITG